VTRRSQVDGLDPTHNDPLLRWLAWLHPAWMLVGLTLAALALKSGLALRRSRAGRARRTPQMRPAHLRFAKPAVLLLLIGFVGGPVSAVWLRGWDAFDTFHAFAGLAAASLFVGAAALGHRIEQGASRSFDRHALLGVLALLFAGLAAVAGFSLLP